MACSMSSSSLSIPELPEKAFHPDSSFCFPKRSFGKSNVKMRSCKAEYFRTWPWLTYDVEKDVVFCHLCIKSVQGKKMAIKRSDPSFLQKGFSYWKDATIAFKNHESSACHKEAVEVSIVLPSACPDVGEMLSSQHSQQKKQNRECLLKILANLKFLARQGIPLRGCGDDADSNFMQLMKMRARDDQHLAEWLEKRTNKYVSHDVQNELLKVMALSVLRDISCAIHESSFYSIMCDECTDASNKEQLVICIRYVTNIDLEVHEDFIGLYMIDDMCAGTIVHVIKDALVRMNLRLNKCRGQCYDGASNMSGPRSGVAKQLLDEEPCALYLHCHGHALNLAAGDAIKNCKVTKDALDVTFEVSKLVKFSPKRTAQLEKLRNELAIESPGFRVLCPTRWTVRAASLKSVLTNYKALQQLWETTKDSTSDPTIKGRIIGVEFQFKTFSFYFGLHLASLILKHTDNLSKTLQSTSMSVTEGAHIAAMTVKTLQSIRSDERYDAFWDLVLRDHQEVDVDDPKLPRKRKVPCRLDEGSAPAHFPTDCKSHYRQSYFEALDLAISAIEDRFDQPHFRIYRHLEDILLRTVRGESAQEEYEFVCQFYKGDFDKQQLQLHLETLQAIFPDDLKSATLSIKDLKQFVLSLSENERVLISEVVTLLKLILILPSTNAVSERSFSAMRRLKTYLRTTMTQERLNHLLLLHIHQDRTDSTSCMEVARSFVGDSEHRLSVFGKFR